MLAVADSPGGKMKHQDREVEDAVERAYSVDRRKLRSIAGRAGQQDEEDLIQDALVRVVERSRKEKVVKLDNMLAHIVRCLALDRLRRHAAGPKYSATERGEQIMDVAADPERSLMGAQRLKRVLAAVEAMPPKRKEVFLLHRVEDLTYTQIAKRLGVSIKTVEKHLHLAMRQLSDTDD